MAPVHRHGLKVQFVSLVLTNPGSAGTIEVQLANMAASVALKAHSVTTLAGDE
jgi:hypothetical protein